MSRALLATSLALALVLWPSLARAEPSPADSLIAAARQKKLADGPSWLHLGHYRKNTFSGHTSEADGDGFFLAKDGKGDPAAELDATLRGFYEPATLADKHPLCRFPARFSFLQKELAIDPRTLPQPECGKLAEFWKRIQTRSITLVFSSYYLNNPSSAFGHTFLRFNKSAPKASQERRALLDSGIDYSATVDTGNPVAYAVKGLLGLFPGTFHVMPYYYKVREYNDFDSRDLWEYDLDLPPDEVEMVAAHVWELGSTYFDYFYATENCSYHVLGALDVANPRYKLMDAVRKPVVPVETLKVVTRVPGLVSAVHFRPSARSTFRARIVGLGSRELGLVATLSDEPDTPLPADLSPEAQAHVLDAALDLIDLRYAKELVDDRDSRGATLKQKLLERRAELGISGDELALEPPPDERPEASHGASRLMLGTGAAHPQRGFLQLDWRLALHDLADSKVGYPPSSHVEFFPLRFRYWMPDKQLRFEDGSLVRIISLNPISRFDMRPSWNLRVGATTLRDDGCRECTFGVVEGGFGATASTSHDGATAWVFAQGQLFGPRIEGPASFKARAGVGPSGGVRLTPHRNLVWLTSAGLSWLPAQTPRTSWTAQSILHWQVAQDFAVRVEARKQPLASEAVVSTVLYY